MLKKLLASLLLTLSLAIPASAQTNLSQGGTGWATSTLGDLLVGTTSKQRYTRLPIGSTGQVLWVLNGRPAWVATSSLGITGGTGGSGNSAWTIGNGLIYNATTSDNVGVGTTTPTQRLNVFGNLLVSTSSTPLLFVNTAISKVGIGVNNNTGGDMLRVSGSIKSDTSVNATIGFFNTLSALSGNKVTLSGDFYLTGGFFDSTNASGTAGQVLQSTGTSTLWVATSSLGISGGTTYTGTYPVIVTGSVISTGFSTSTINSFTAANSFAATTSVTEIRALNSAGVDIHANTGTQVALFGAGGSDGTSFFGGVNAVNGLINLATTTISALNLSGFFKDSTNASGTLGQVLKSTGTSTMWVSTSSLGFTTGTVTSVSLSAPTGLTAASTTCTADCKLALTLTAGYVIPLTASTTEWAAAYASTTALTPAYIRGLFSGTAPITFNSGTGAIGCTNASAGVTGCLTGTDWSTFNSKVSNAYASSSFPSFTYGSSTYAFASNFSGVTGKVARWTSAAALSVGSLFDNGTVSGVNATSSTVAFNIQGLPALATIFNVASSTGTSIFSILSTGQLLYGTSTITSYGLTVGTTTQFTAGVVSRVVGYSSAASTTINLNTTDVATTTINQPTTFVNPTGTAYDGQMFEIRARATTTQTIYWGTNFASSTDLVNVASVASGTTRFLFEYRQDVQKWELVGKLGGYIN